MKFHCWDACCASSAGLPLAVSFNGDRYITAEWLGGLAYGSFITIGLAIYLFIVAAAD